MNTALRAVTRRTLDLGWEVFGVRRGYTGLIEGHLETLNARSVGDIIQQGATILGSARSPKFQTEEGRMEALRQLRQQELEALVVIGGNGS